MVTAASSSVTGIRAVTTPLLLEFRAFWEWFALQISPVYHGLGVKRGRKQPVMLIPGFLAADTTLTALFTWLWRMGYKPYFSGIGINWHCPDDHIAQIATKVDQIYAETLQPVILIGQSLGGMFAAAVAEQRSEKVGLVITLGTPQSETSAVHPWLVQAAEFVGGRVRAENKRLACYTRDCTCVFGDITRGGIEADVCIHSNIDGVADSNGTKSADPTRNHQVNGATHIGMGFNPGVYRVIADKLPGDVLLYQLPRSRAVA